MNGYFFNKIEIQTKCLTFKKKFFSVWPMDRFKGKTSLGSYESRYWWNYSQLCQHPLGWPEGRFNGLANVFPVRLFFREIASFISKLSSFNNFFYNFRDARLLSASELKRVTEIFTRMFSDAHTKVFALFLETLTELVMSHKADLGDWIYILITRLLNKLGADLLGE